MPGPDQEKRNELFSRLTEGVIPSPEREINMETVSPQKHTIEIPRDRLGRYKWSTFANQPELLVKAIEQEVKALIPEGGKLGTLPTVLKTATQKYYPGSINGLRTNLGQEILKRDAGSWTPESIEAEAREILNKYGSLTQKTLADIGRSDLVAAAFHFYPGSLPKLQENLGITPSQKPRGYYTPETMLADAKQIHTEYGGISEDLLRSIGQSSLAIYISRRYPNGMSGLRQDLGLQTLKKDNFWSIETIESESRQLLSAGIELTQLALTQAKRTDLHGAIRTHYPGGIRKLRENLGLALVKKPDGYWTLETIEQEALDFLQKHGTLSVPLLTSQKRNDLVIAIARKYPGGIKALREKLTTLPKEENTISPEEAESILDEEMGWN